jgi:hypothetical protein
MGIFPLSFRRDILCSEILGLQWTVECQVRPYRAEANKTFLLSETDQNLYDDARKWYKTKIRASTIAELGKARFEVHWVHDLLYDR